MPDITINFGYTGSRQTYVVPDNAVSIFASLSGAGGGSFTGAGYLGGSGGLWTGYIDFEPGTTLNIYVGGHGTGGSTCTGGYNGGGGGYNNNNGYNGAGGGGATDIRWDVHLTGDGTSLGDRVACAGGGGGAASGSSGNGLGSNGGDGGADTGQNGHGGGSTVAQGGSTTAGGAGGKGGAANGFNGSLGVGGNGYPYITTNSHSGGGGGGGWYGGGGGCAFTGAVTGQSGAGGSNWYYSRTTMPAPTTIRGGGSADSTHGSVQLIVAVRDDVLSTDAFAATGAMSLAGTKAITSGLTASVLAGMTTSPTVIRTGPNPMRAAGQLTAVRAAATLTGTFPMTASARLTETGVRTTAQSSPMASVAGLVLQQTLSRLDLAAQTSMTISDLGTSFGSVAMATHGSLTDSGLDILTRGLSVSSTATMAISRLITHAGSVTMAAHGAVVDSAALSKLGVGHLVGTARMTLTGAHTALGAVSVLAASGMMLIPSPVRHPEALALAAHTSMTVGPTHFIFVGPGMRALARLTIGTIIVSTPMAMSALAQMLFAEGEGQVLDAPYLIITDANNQVAFFVTSFPNKGSVRQRVVRHV